MRSVIEHRRYDPDLFLQSFIDYFATPGRNGDAYLEAYIRYWFENYSRGLPARSCAAQQRDDWSIASHGGLIRPLALSLLAPNDFQSLGTALEHHNLTHRSETNAASLGLLIPLVNRLVGGAGIRSELKTFGMELHLPEISGKALFDRYAEAGGPYNIPKDEMWDLHARFRPEPFDVEAWVRDRSDAEVIRTGISTACYPEHGLPLMLYLAFRHDLDFEKSLLANANAGGDNVHRGAVMGLVLGAGTERIPEHLKTGLLEAEAIGEEIGAFVELSGRTGVL
jgi:ADP-ribosylglycohydrolase